MSVSWSMKKNCRLPNYDDQKRVTLSHSGKRPTGTATAPDPKDSVEEFSDVVIVVFRGN